MYRIYVFLCQAAHNISTGCKNNLNQAINGVMWILPSIKGARISILICTGKKAASMSTRPQAAKGLVLEDSSINAKAISKPPAISFINLGKAIYAGIIDR